MKKLRIYIIASALLAVLISCNENNWLEETPKSFYTPDNSYETSTQFRQSLNYQYDLLRSFQWTLGGLKGGSAEGVIALETGISSWRYSFWWY